MKVLIIGSGHYYIYGNRCVPISIYESFKDIINDPLNTITLLDEEPAVKPDIIANVLRNDWWLKLSEKYDIIIDTISHIGPHIRRSPQSQKIYCDTFKKGVSKLLEPNGKFYGFCEL